jgi:hypothetical protein
MKPIELGNRQLLALFEERCLDLERVLSEPLQPEGRPPERKAKLQRLERNRERLHAELLRRLGMVEQ